MPRKKNPQPSPSDGSAVASNVFHDDELTADDIVGDLNRILEENRGPEAIPGFRSVAQMHEQTGWAMGRVRSTLKKAKKQGRLARREVRDETIAGVEYRVPVYRILPPTKD